MIKKELHLVIVWDAAKDAYNKIIEVIDEKFTIKEVYEITWDKEVFIKNLISFYSQSQSHLNKRQTNKLFKGKAKYCGIAPFKLIIFEDNNPNYQLRKTSSGYRKVNLNVFDLKLQFRELTGGGHKIHGTDSVKETNKDLTLLLGDNIIDFYKKHNGNWDKKSKVALEIYLSIKILDAKCFGMDPLVLISITLHGHLPILPELIVRYRPL